MTLFKMEFKKKKLCDDDNNYYCNNLRDLIIKNK